MRHPFPSETLLRDSRRRSLLIVVDGRTFLEGLPDLMRDEREPYVYVDELKALPLTGGPARPRVRLPDADAGLESALDRLMTFVMLAWWAALTWTMWYLAHL